MKNTTLREKGWLALKTDPDLACEIFGWSNLLHPPERMSAEDYCARAMGSLFGAALEAVDETGFDPQVRLKFEGDLVRKPQLATRAVHEAARQWAMPGYNALRAKRLW